MAFETNQFKHSAFGASARRSLNATSTSTTAAFSTLAPKPTSHPRRHPHHAQPALAQEPLDSLPTVVLRNRHAFAPATAVSASAATALQLHESAFSAAAKEKAPTVRKKLASLLLLNVFSGSARRAIV
jgi:hypothetical protein